ncbi:putative methyltransferase (putative) [Ligilactobacillus apodemi DSM 16634 = JCM 16172]|uniref:Putative methyltransferase (Putative) n=1 Tax=Ligilactobacillus apodemi DSM 16634 = JCM 16172 TaxID=1423724 RepID=A0A0R1TR58_9LACO|nr:class I SAM-dependent methyltransferase [Ligilactobacillus apodemi]KRL83673.1 putative methyltransferase (putative) [Ligilactobacillus apodemi DSM 16634 = JCM 16172]
MIYSSFAKLYDELMDPTMYDQWLEFVNQELDPTEGEVLDLACGAGRLAVMMAKAGYRVSGVDLSEEMLSLAEMHAREANLELAFMQGNMLDLSELATFSAITCFADSFCYLKDEAQLLQAFNEVYNHLEADGKFIFDVITPYQTDEIYPGYMYNYTDETQAFIWSSFADDFEHSAVHELTFFVWNETLQSYERVSEVHHERTYELEKYLALLAKAGFKNIQVSADFGKAVPDEKTTRWFFSCQK